MLNRSLKSQHIRPNYLYISKSLKQSIYQTILMTAPSQQPPVIPLNDHVDDLELKAPLKWNHQFTTTRMFSSTSPNQKQSTVQVIRADQLKRYPSRNNQSTSTMTEELKEASVTASTVATAMAATVRTTRSSQSTTEVIQAQTVPNAPPLHFKPSRPPTLEEYIDRLPTISLPPNYTVITTKSMEEVDKELPIMIRQESVFGFDMEWKPSFRKGVPQSPTGLIQICGATKVLVIQVSQMQVLPTSLVQFLTDHTIFKTGVNIRGDGVKLARDFKVLTDGLLDLRNIAVEALEMLPVPPHCYSSKSLRSLTGIFMGMNMPKGRVRCSNWNAAQLSPLQVEYAANDAYASYALYHILLDATKLTKSDLRPRHLSREGI